MYIYKFFIFVDVTMKSSSPSVHSTHQLISIRSVRLVSNRVIRGNVHMTVELHLSEFTSSKSNGLHG